MEKLAKNDFVEIEYTARIKDSNEIFDSSDKHHENNKQEKDNKPLIICLGQGMILNSVDQFLIGKEPGEYGIELTPEKAFGVRTRKLVKTMPLAVFQKQNIKPEQGMVFSFDNLLGKISAVSGGRVIVDFNHPLANKEVIYQVKIRRKVVDEKEKVKALMLAFLRKEFEFEIDDKKLIVKAAKEFKQFLEIFKEKFKEILNLDLQVKEIQEKPENR